MAGFTGSAPTGVTRQTTCSCPRAPPPNVWLNMLKSNTSSNGATEKLATNGTGVVPNPGKKRSCPLGSYTATYTSTFAAAFSGFTRDNRTFILSHPQL